MAESHYRNAIETLSFARRAKFSGYLMVAIGLLKKSSLKANERLSEAFTGGRTCQRKPC